MSDALPDDTWINNFLSSPPRPLQAALQKRLHASTTHLNSLAEIYKQRAAIETQYAESLAKLARSAEQGSLLPKAGIEWDKSSGEGKIWETVVNEISETSSSHSTLAAMLRADFEQPIREMPSKIVAWRRIGDQDASLEKTLKDYEKTSAKLEKASSKSKSSKADVLSSELNQITSSLASLSPMVYTSYQRLDEERLRGLKEVIVRWGTVRADMAQKDGERAERAVAVLISWETQDEVQAVGRRLGGSGNSAGSRGTAAPSLNSVSTTPQSMRRQPSINNPGEDFSPRPAPRQNGSSNNLAPASFATGIKSMLGRKNTSAGGGRARSGSNATSVRSGRDRDPSFAPIGEDDDSRRNSAAPPVDEEGFSVAPANRHRSPWDEPDDIPQIAPPLAPTLASSVPNGTSKQLFTTSPDGSTEELASPLSASSGQPKINMALAPAPIQEDEEERLAALQKMQQTLQMQPPQQPSRRQTIARGRRDVRNTMFGTLGESALASPTPTESSLHTPSAPVLQQNTVSPADRPLPSRQTSVSSVSSNNLFDSPGLGNSLQASQTSDAPGLRASMTEVVNAIVREGQVQRLQINGEIYLSLRTSPGSTTNQGPIHIRLTEFEGLEKIAPNPAFLAQVPDRPGEYFLNSEVLASAPSTGGKGTLLFKYQVYIPAGTEMSALPLVLEPAFRCSDGESRMILNYKINETSRLTKLSNVSISASFGPGPSVSNVQAKPAGGVWSPSTRRMTWNMDDITDGGKIIAKFLSEPGSPLTPQGVQANWSVEGSLSSGIGIDVVHGDLEIGLDFAEVKKLVTTGKYLAEAVTQ